MPPQEIFVFRLSEIESGAFSGTTLTDILYCGMGVLEALVAIQIPPCDIVNIYNKLTIPRGGKILPNFTKGGPAPPPLYINFPY